MGRPTYIRLIIFSLISALALSVCSMLFLSRLSDMGATEHRSRFFLFLASSIEESLRKLPVESWSNQEELKKVLRFPFDGKPPPPFRPGPPRGERGDFPPPPPPGGDGMFGGPRMPPGPPPPSFMRPPGDSMGRKGPPRFAPKLWLVGREGQVLFKTSKDLLPFSWGQAELPKVANEVFSDEDFFRIFPGTYIVKIDVAEPLYLVIKDDSKPPFIDLFGTQAILIFVTVIMAFLISLSFIFFYLQRKSIEARAVLLRLEKGDLKARFEIKRFDETAGLLIDFNRMAHEIEKLVTRVHTIESTRKNLLQELGHDLRTPLTSLRTSFETLKVHYERISEKDRNELFDMIEAEVKYFRELLEQLMTIAALDEPIYKSSTETIDIADILNVEVRSRQSSSALQWYFQSEFNDQHRALILGDSNLIMRLLKNAFDNASRFAKSEVRISLVRKDDFYHLKVVDDGPGLSVEDLSSFAKRREKRIRRQGEGLNFSLGLGSVIMKSISELHGGSIEIRNVQVGSGAELEIQLPLAPFERLPKEEV